MRSLRKIGRSSNGPTADEFFIAQPLRVLDIRRHVSLDCSTGAFWSEKSDEEWSISQQLTQDG